MQGYIGFFDSGIGGLTLLSECAALLPGEKFVYLGDNARAPYGGRPEGEIRAFAAEAFGALSAYPAVQVSAAQSRRFSNGGALDRTRVRADRTDGLCRVYSDSGDFLGLGQWTQEALAVKRILVKRD